jgi:BolA protein
MTIQGVIEDKLVSGLNPLHLEVINESSNHNVPEGSESHFKVVIVSHEFDGDRLIQQHRKVNSLLADVLKNDIHALAIHTYTQEQWQLRHGDKPMSPPCLGGGRTGGNS